MSPSFSLPAGSSTPRSTTSSKTGCTCWASPRRARRRRPTRAWRARTRGGSAAALRLRLADGPGVRGVPSPGAGASSSLGAPAPEPPPTRRLLVAVLVAASTTRPRTSGKPCGSNPNSPAWPRTFVASRRSFSPKAHRPGRSTYSTRWCRLLLRRPSPAALAAARQPRRPYDQNANLRPCGTTGGCSCVLVELREALRLPHV